MKRVRTRLENWIPENTILDEVMRLTSVPLSAIAGLAGPAVQVIKAVCKVAKAHVRRHKYNGISVEPMVELERTDNGVAASIACVIRDKNGELLDPHCRVVHDALVPILRAGADVAWESIRRSRDGSLHVITADPKKKGDEGVIYHKDALVVRFALDVLSIPGTGSVCLEVDDKGSLCIPLTVTGRPGIRDDGVERFSAEVIEVTKPTEQARARLRVSGKRCVVRSVTYDDEHYEALLDAMRMDGEKWVVGLARITHRGAGAGKKRLFRLMSIERST